MQYEMNTTYRVTDEGLRQYQQCVGINKHLVKSIGNALWTVFSISEDGNVESIRLASNGKIIDVQTATDQKYQNSKYCLFTKYELKAGVVKKVTKAEEQDGPVEYTIMVKAPHSDKFVMVRGDNSTHLFTLKRAKEIVSKGVKNNPDAEFQIFKLSLSAYAKKQEVNVIFEQK